MILSYLGLRLKIGKVGYLVVLNFIEQELDITIFIELNW